MIFSNHFFEDKLTKKAEGDKIVNINTCFEYILFTERKQDHERNKEITCGNRRRHNGVKYACFNIS